MKLVYLCTVVFPLLLVIPSSNAYAIESCYVVNNEEVIHRKIIIEAKKDVGKCQAKDRKNVDEAIAVIKAFWLAKDNHISFFSIGYRKVIEANNLVTYDLHKYIFSYERFWSTQKYQTSYHQDDKNIQVIVLSTWSQEGYTGTTTFTFELIYEHGKWKIDLLIY